MESSEEDIMEGALEGSRVLDGLEGRRVRRLAGCVVGERRRGRFYRLDILGREMALTEAMRQAAIKSAQFRE